MQRYRKKLAEAHLKISATLLVQTKNSTDLERVAATQLKSVEFFVCTTRVTEIFDVHTDFTAGEMLHLYRSMTPQAASHRETTADKERRIEELEERARLYGDSVKQSAVAKALDREKGERGPMSFFCESYPIHFHLT